MQKTVAQNEGFTVDRASVRRSDAESLAAARGLALPDGVGRLTFFTCNLTGRSRVSLTSIWNSGRVTHKQCCGIHGSSDSFSRPLRCTLLQDRGGFSRSSPLTRGSNVPAMFDESIPTAQLVLRVTQAGIERSFTLPPDGVVWAKWFNLVQSDPLNAPPPPAVVLSSKALMQTVEDAQRCLGEFVWAIHKVNPSIGPGADALPKVPRLGLLPAILPKYMYGPPNLLKPIDWSTTPYTPLSPTHCAALAVMLAEWSAAAPKDPKEVLRHTIFQRQGMSVPHHVVPREWFREVPPLEGDLDQEQPLSELPTGEVIALRDQEHLVLMHRPKTNVTLPSNWHEDLNKWDWDKTVKLEVEWPEHWMDLPEIG